MKLLIVENYQTAAKVNTNGGKYFSKLGLCRYIIDNNIKAGSYLFASYDAEDSNYSSIESEFEGPVKPSLRPAIEGDAWVLILNLRSKPKVVKNKRGGAKLFNLEDAYLYAKALKAKDGNFLTMMDEYSYTDFLGWLASIDALPEELKAHAR